MAACRICGNEKGNRPHVLREMRHGTRETFDYLECRFCGSMQIAEIPDDLSRHYGDAYYSFKPRKKRLRDVLKRFVRGTRAKRSLSGKGLMGAVFRAVYGEPRSFRWFRKAQIDFDSRVLDVGCGSGGVLLRMQFDGFRNLTGVDKFVDDSVLEDDRLNILKCEIFDVEGPFDFILMNHSLEHVADPLATLRHLARILRPGRFALIRTPVAGCRAWELYGTDWVQLDAPRHLHVFSEKAMALLAERAGLELDEVVYDSRSLQFWGSIQFQKGIPLVAETSWGENPSRSVFSRKEIDGFKEEAIRLNGEGRGDQAQFYLRKPEG